MCNCNTAVAPGASFTCGTSVSSRTGTLSFSYTGNGQDVDCSFTNNITRPTIVLISFIGTTNDLYELELYDNGESLGFLSGPDLLRKGRPAEFKFWDHRIRFRFPAKGATGESSTAKWTVTWDAWNAIEGPSIVTLNGGQRSYPLCTIDRRR
jgi:hypothetical protein